MKKENNNFNEDNTDKLDVSEINRRFYEQQYQKEEEKKRKTDSRNNSTRKTKTKKSVNYTPFVVFLVTLLVFSTVALAIYTISNNKKFNETINELKLSKETEVTEELEPVTDISTEEAEVEEDDDFDEFEEVSGSLTQDLNFRSGPGYEYETIGTIPRGTEVSGYIDKSGWLKIQYNGQTGYIGPQYVE